ncbi:hypothetical protein ACIHFC_30750 [Streptomyces sp. NPDC052013]|uniref:hypothetical protein n=1 Tax=Streptomyces sp. NPDC052013 TaxID=3365679 RepID=UPI0037D8DB38
MRHGSRITAAPPAALGRTTALPGRVPIEDNDDNRRFHVVDPQPELAAELLTTAYADSSRAAGTRGNIRAAENIEQVAGALARADQRETAETLAAGLVRTPSSSGSLLRPAPLEGDVAGLQPATRRCRCSCRARSRAGLGPSRGRIGPAYPTTPSLDRWNRVPGSIRDVVTGEGR